MVRITVALVLLTTACAGSDAPQPATASPEPAIPTVLSADDDSAWVPGVPTLAGRIITVDGGMVTLPGAFTVEVEPATLTDTQTVTVSLADTTRYISFVTDTAIARRPPWIATVAFARTCPPRPVNVRAVVPAAYRDSLRVIPHIRAAADSFHAVTEHFEIGQGSVREFAIPAERFSTRGGSGRCEAAFALPLVR